MKKGIGSNARHRHIFRSIQLEIYIALKYNACPCVYACGLESLCTEKDVSAAVHSMKGWFSTPMGVDLYLSLLCLQCLAALSTHLYEHMEWGRVGATAEERKFDITERAEPAQPKMHVVYKAADQHTKSHGTYPHAIKHQLSSGSWKAGCFTCKVSHSHSLGAAQYKHSSNSGHCTAPVHVFTLPFPSFPSFELCTGKKSPKKP